MLSLPVSIIFHLMIGIYMYGTPLIFPFDNDSINIDINKNIGTSLNAS